MLQVRNVLTNLVDIAGRPGMPLLDLLLDKAVDPDERSRLTQVRDVLAKPGGPDTPLRAAIEAGPRALLRQLDEFPSCSLNIFEFLGRGAVAAAAQVLLGEPRARVHGEGVIQVTASLEATLRRAGPLLQRDGLGTRMPCARRPGFNVPGQCADGFRLQQDDQAGMNCPGGQPGWP